MASVMGLMGPGPVRDVTVHTTVQQSLKESLLKNASHLAKHEKFLPGKDLNHVLFPVDASKAGEGQLEISINDGDVPNAVQVLGGGKCLVTFTPEQAITHEIEVTFNNDQVPGSPFLARVRDADNLSGAGSSGGLANGYDHVTVELEHLALVAVAEPAEFTIRVPEGADAELAVSVQGPVEDIPVKVTGNVKNGFVAQFIPNAVGLHVVLVEYNGVAVGGTPFYCKAFDTDAVQVEGVGKGVAGKTVTFAGKNQTPETVPSVPVAAAAQ